MYGSLTIIQWQTLLVLNERSSASIGVCKWTCNFIMFSCLCPSSSINTHYIVSWSMLLPLLHFCWCNITSLIEPGNQNNDIKHDTGYAELRIQFNGQALVIWTQGSHSLKWASIRYIRENNLQQRTLEIQNVDIHEGIKCYWLALQVGNRESIPYEWAMAQSTIGNAFYDRTFGNRKENIDDAYVLTPATCNNVCAPRTFK